MRRFSGQAVRPAARSSLSGPAVPVRRSASNGGFADTDTVTASGPEASHRAGGDPVAGSSSGLPSRPARTGTCPATAAEPAARAVSAGVASVTVAAAARASAVRASSGSVGPGSTSKSIASLD